jgi:hypothetical protein
MSQIQLFETVKTIPDRHLGMMINANSNAKHTRWAAYWYELKDKILKNYGSDCGYDYQLIEHQCWNCQGSGIYSIGNTCRSCGGTGIYSTERIVLQRFVINGEIFHKPINKVSSLADIFEYRVQKIINGVIAHKRGDEKQAFIDFILLSSIYDRYNCAFLMNSVFNIVNRKDKKELRHWGYLVDEVCKYQKSHHLTHALSIWFNLPDFEDLSDIPDEQIDIKQLMIKIKEDDLPF